MVKISNLFYGMMNQHVTGCSQPFFSPFISAMSALTLTHHHHRKWQNQTHCTGSHSFRPYHTWYCDTGNQTSPSYVPCVPNVFAEHHVLVHFSPCSVGFDSFERFYHLSNVTGTSTAMNKLVYVAAAILFLQGCLAFMLRPSVRRFRKDRIFFDTSFCSIPSLPKNTQIRRHAFSPKSSLDEEEDLHGENDDKVSTTESDWMQAELTLR